MEKTGLRKLGVLVEIHGTLAHHGGQFVEHLIAEEAVVSQFLTYLIILRPEVVRLKPILFFSTFLETKKCEKTEAYESYFLILQRHIHKTLVLLLKI